MPERSPVQITLVTSPSCHLCADAEEALAALGRDHALSVTVVDLRSQEGTALARSARAPMSPLVLVDGEVFSWGRLPRRKLRRLLERRANARTVS